ncbi:MAG: transcription antitermination factor NusB [Clostridia bacterium]|nr:transcription antitermination factor NusB [Clostridia bacterium]MDD4275418.1 transcription antitermination factor NusB [Clostridia bacterium]
MSRTNTREIAFKLIFEYSFTKEIVKFDLPDFSSFYNAQLIGDDSEYLKKVYENATEHYDELIKIITDNLIGYTISRIYKIDLAVLILSTCELMYLPEIPQSVSINEAVELSKRYSTDKSSGFINGVLAKILTTINSEKK